MSGQLDQLEVAPEPSEARPDRAAENPEGRGRALGLSLIVASTLALAVMSLLVRYARTIEGLTTYSVTLVRFVVGAAAVLVISRLTGTKLRTGNLRLLAARGALGAVAVTAFFYSITHIGLAKGTVLFSTFPLWAALLAVVFLREPVRVRLALAMLVAFGGMYLVVVPPGGFSGVSGTDLVAIAGGMVGGGAIVTVRRLRATESTLVIFLSQCLLGMAVTLLPAAASPPPLVLSAWAVLVAVGAAATAGQLMLTSAYRYVRVSEAAPINMLTPVWNVALGALVFGEALTTRGLAGAALVIGACTYATWPGRRAAVPSVP